MAEIFLIPNDAGYRGSAVYVRTSYTFLVWSAATPVAAFLRRSEIGGPADYKSAFRVA
ncbi:MAG TPA: hypothetical protein VNA69_18445 [Thermoanaerobaculia bacterium]|nr:hypothetical protein [Thermoanaerobaculia bacterium]